MNRREFLVIAGTGSLIAIPALPTLAQPATEPLSQADNPALPDNQIAEISGGCSDILQHCSVIASVRCYNIQFHVEFIMYSFCKPAGLNPLIIGKGIKHINRDLLRVICRRILTCGGRAPARCAHTYYHGCNCCYGNYFLHILLHIHQTFASILPFSDTSHNL